MFIFYDLIFLLFSIIYLPVYFFKRKFHPGFSLRLGFLPKGLELNRPIWIHAVSVGEAMAIRLLVDQLRNIYPGKKFVISTVTPTGNKIASSIVTEGDFVTYLPLDLSFIMKAVLDRINPCAFIIAETEIWPNLIFYLYKKKIPIITVNGRISDSSFKGYLAIKFLIKNILRKVTLFCVQTERDAGRFKALGVSEEKIKVTGNMKFDSADYIEEKSTDYTDLKRKLGLEKKDKIFIAASTHPEEEEIILNVYKRLWEEFPNLNLIIAPRHPQRCKEVARIASNHRFCSKFISSFTPQSIACATKSVFILDVIGRLMDFYSIADIVFVGGSLIKKGGHNILEPASLAKPIIFGPYMFNFRDIADLFLSNNAAILATEEEIKTKIVNLLNNPLVAVELGKKAKQLIQQNQGATRRNVEFIRKFVV
jgi:3-deoxy-D-manno-octulosonic-acid transferase